ncbi:hypothetical protein BJ085DRAFT_35468, partial [Dimargaris cristalligena]
MEDSQQQAANKSIFTVLTFLGKARRRERLRRENSFPKAPKFDIFAPLPPEAYRPPPTQPLTPTVTVTPAQAPTPTASPDRYLGRATSEAGPSSQPARPSFATRRTLQPSASARSHVPNPVDTRYIPRPQSTITAEYVGPFHPAAPRPPPAAVAASSMEPDRRSVSSASTWDSQTSAVSHFGSRRPRLFGKPLFPMLRKRSKHWRPTRTTAIQTHSRSTLFSQPHNSSRSRVPRTPRNGSRTQFSPRTSRKKRHGGGVTSTGVGTTTEMGTDPLDVDDHPVPPYHPQSTPGPSAPARRITVAEGVNQRGSGKEAAERLRAALRPSHTVPQHNPQMYPHPPGYDVPGEPTQHDEWVDTGPSHDPATAWRMRRRKKERARLNVKTSPRARSPLAEQLGPSELEPVPELEPDPELEPEMEVDPSSVNPKDLPRRTSSMALHAQFQEKPHTVVRTVKRTQTRTSIRPQPSHHSGVSSAHPHSGGPLSEETDYGKPIRSTTITRTTARLSPPGRAQTMYVPAGQPHPNIDEDPEPMSYPAGSLGRKSSLQERTRGRDSAYGDLTTATHVMKAYQPSSAFTPYHSQVPTRPAPSQASASQSANIYAPVLTSRPQEWFPMSSAGAPQYPTTIMMPPLANLVLPAPISLSSPPEREAPLHHKGSDNSPRVRSGKPPPPSAGGHSSDSEHSPSSERTVEAIHRQTSRLQVIGGGPFSALPPLGTLPSLPSTVHLQQALNLEPLTLDVNPSTTQVIPSAATVAVGRAPEPESKLEPMADSDRESPKVSDDPPYLSLRFLKSNTPEAYRLAPSLFDQPFEEFLTKQERKLNRQVSTASYHAAQGPITTTIKPQFAATSPRGRPPSYTPRATTAAILPDLNMFSRAEINQASDGETNLVQLAEDCMTGPELTEEQQALANAPIPDVIPDGCIRDLLDMPDSTGLASPFEIAADLDSAFEDHDYHQDQDQAHGHDRDPRSYRTHEHDRNYATEELQYRQAQTQAWANSIPSTSPHIDPLSEDQSDLSQLLRRAAPEFPSPRSYHPAYPESSMEAAVDDEVMSMPDEGNEFNTDSLVESRPTALFLQSTGPLLGGGAGGGGDHTSTSTTSFPPRQQPTSTTYPTETSPPDRRKARAAARMSVTQSPPTRSTGSGEARSLALSLSPRTLPTTGPSDKLRHRGSIFDGVADRPGTERTISRKVYHDGPYQVVEEIEEVVEIVTDTEEARDKHPALDTAEGRDQYTQPYESETGAVPSESELESEPATESHRAMKSHHSDPLTPSAFHDLSLATDESLPPLTSELPSLPSSFDNALGGGSGSTGLPSDQAFPTARGGAPYSQPEPRLLSPPLAPRSEKARGKQPAAGSQSGSYHLPLSFTPPSSSLPLPAPPVARPQSPPRPKLWEQYARTIHGGGHTPRSVSDVSDPLTHPGAGAGPGYPQTYSPPQLHQRTALPDFTPATDAATNSSTEYNIATPIRVPYLDGQSVSLSAEFKRGLLQDLSGTQPNVPTRYYRYDPSANTKVEPSPPAVPATDMATTAPESDSSHLVSTMDHVKFRLSMLENQLQGKQSMKSFYEARPPTGPQPAVPTTGYTRSAAPKSDGRNLGSKSTTKMVNQGSRPKSVGASAGGGGGGGGPGVTWNPTNNLSPPQPGLLKPSVSTLEGDQEELYSRREFDPSSVGADGHSTSLPPLSEYPPPPLLPLPPPPVKQPQATGPSPKIALPPRRRPSQSTAANHANPIAAKYQSPIHLPVPQIDTTAPTPPESQKELAAVSVHVYSRPPSHPVNRAIASSPRTSEDWGSPGRSNTTTTNSTLSTGNATAGSAGVAVQRRVSWLPSHRPTSPIPVSEHLPRTPVSPTRPNAMFLDSPPSASVRTKSPLNVKFWYHLDDPGHPLSTDARREARRLSQGLGVNVDLQNDPTAAADTQAGMQRRRSSQSARFKPPPSPSPPPAGEDVSEELPPVPTSPPSTKPRSADDEGQLTDLETHVKIALLEAMALSNNREELRHNNSLGGGGDRSHRPRSSRRSRAKTVTARQASARPHHNIANPTLKATSTPSSPVVVPPGNRGTTVGREGDRGAALLPMSHPPVTTVTMLASPPNQDHHSSGYYNANNRNNNNDNNNTMSANADRPSLRDRWQHLTSWQKSSRPPKHVNMADIMAQHTDIEAAPTPAALPVHSTPAAHNSRMADVRRTTSSSARPSRRPSRSQTPNPTTKLPTPDVAFDKAFTPRSSESQLNDSRIQYITPNPDPPAELAPVPLPATAWSQRLPIPKKNRPTHFRSGATPSDPTRHPSPTTTPGNSRPHSIAVATMSTTKDQPQNPPSAIPTGPAGGVGRRGTISGGSGSGAGTGKPPGVQFFLPAGLPSAHQQSTRSAVVPLSRLAGSSSVNYYTSLTAPSNTSHSHSYTNDPSQQPHRSSLIHYELQSPGEANSTNYPIDRVL